MFTRCPECLNTQRITPEMLRSGRGMVRCLHCASMFDALSSLAESETNAVADVQSSPSLLTEEKTLSPLLWRTGLLFGLALLCAQLIYFEGQRAIQHAKIRPVLEKICTLLHCRLPDYKNLAELTVLQSSYSQLSNQHYVFKLVLNNEADFSMHYPNIDLTLLSYDGQPFAHRLFKPTDYLVSEKQRTLLDANTAAEISIEIAATEKKVGGFGFDLSY